MVSHFVTVWGACHENTRNRTHETRRTSTYACQSGNKTGFPGLCNNICTQAIHKKSFCARVCTIVFSARTRTGYLHTQQVEYFQAVLGLQSYSCFLATRLYSCSQYKAVTNSIKLTTKSFVPPPLVLATTRHSGLKAHQHERLVNLLKPCVNDCGIQSLFCVDS